jgi:DNA-binding transcriptional regulator YiaG
MKPAAPRELLRFVDADEFKHLRQDAVLTHQQVANALGYSVQTIKNWEGGKTRIPWPAFELMQIRNCHHLPG